MTNFEFATANRIIFGSGTFQNTGTLTQSMGKRALIVSGLSNELTDPLLDQLSNVGIKYQVFHVSKEPTIPMVQTGVFTAQKFGCDLVIGLGGGSAVDSGKAIAALASNPGVPLDYLEVIGKGQPLIQPPLTYIAIPTTAGTGAEVTRNAVLASPDQQVKVSLRSHLMLPKLAIIDPKFNPYATTLYHRKHRFGCANAVHRTFHISSSQPTDRCDMSGWNPFRSSLSAKCI